MSTKNSPILKLDNVTKKFKTEKGDLSILDGVTLSINAGEKVAIIGPSGSGKSTLLSLIGLLDTPSSGSITIAGVKTESLSETEQAAFRNKKIGFIFQSFELITPFTVYENIISPLEIGYQDIPQTKIDKLITTLGLTPRRDVLPYTLSGGEKQRVAIARAMVSDPAILLADEPTGSLDRATGETVLSLLLSAVEENKTTLIIITHDESIANKMDRVFEIRDRLLHERV